MKGSKRYVRAAISFLTIVALFLVCPGSLCCAPGDITNLQKVFDDALPRWMAKREVPGVAIGIVIDGNVAWVKGYGYADKDRGILVTENTVFQAASISKAVSAWMVMKLVEQGRLQLDVPISAYLTRWRLPPSRFDSDKVTLRRILSHTAGLSVSGYSGFMPGVRLQTLEESLTAAKDAANQPLAIVFPPGSGLHYSGGGYTLLQLVVEGATRQPFAEFAQKAVLTPLGMNDSTLKASQAVKNQMAVAYDQAGDALPDYRFTAEAAAGLRTTAQDLARFVAALMPGPVGEPQGCGVLNPQSIKDMLSPQPHSSNDLLFHDSNWGLGYGLKRLHSRRGLAGFSSGGQSSGMARNDCGASRAEERIRSSDQR